MVGRIHLQSCTKLLENMLATQKVAKNWLNRHMLSVGVVHWQVTARDAVLVATAQPITKDLADSVAHTAAIHSKTFPKRRSAAHTSLLPSSLVPFSFVFPFFLLPPQAAFHLLGTLRSKCSSCRPFVYEEGTADGIHCRVLGFVALHAGTAKHSCTAVGFDHNRCCDTITDIVKRALIETGSASVSAAARSKACGALTSIGC